MFRLTFVDPSLETNPDAQVWRLSLEESVNNEFIRLLVMGPTPTEGYGISPAMEEKP